MTRTLLAAPLAALLAAAGALVPTTPAVAAAPPRVTADFNKDGFGDLAVAAPFETINRRRAAGAVSVFYGSADGLVATGSQFWHQDSPGIAGGAEPLDGFGAALAAGDLDGDGFSDLVIGAPGEDVGATADAGLVHVLYGSGAGLVASGSVIWHETAPGVPQSTASDHDFGVALAVGDFDDDGRDDMAVGGSGAVWTFNGAATRPSQPVGVFADPNSGSDTSFGNAVGAGDFNGDGRDDVAIGAPDESKIEGSGTPRTVEGAGRVWVYFGDVGGVVASGSVALDQDTPGVNGAPERGDAFGFNVAAGDFDGDGKDELAVGSPFDSLTGSADAGVVHVFPGTVSGPAGGGSQLWHQSIAGVPGEPEQGPGSIDGFGFALATGDFDKDGFEDLAIGTPFDEVGQAFAAGTVTVLYGTASRLTAARVQLWHQNSAGVPGAAEVADFFGAALSGADVDGSGFQDLAVGVPGEDLRDGDTDEGAAQLLMGGGSGLTAAPESWHQNSPGVPGLAEFADQFGFAVTG